MIRFLTWLDQFLERAIRRRAENDTMRAFGVSREYVQAVIVEYETLVGGRISRAEWERRAVEIAYRFPRESHVKDILEESEFRV